LICNYTISNYYLSLCYSLQYIFKATGYLSSFALFLCVWTETVTMHMISKFLFNPLNSELNSICHLLVLLGAHHIFHVSRIRVKLSYGKEIEMNFRRRSIPPTTYVDSAL
jgi:hypothetical protein